MLPLTLATVRKQDPGLILEEWQGARGRRADPVCVASKFCFLFLNFQMNNSVALPRLKYFSVFSKM